MLPTISLKAEVRSFPNQGLVMMMMVVVVVVLVVVMMWWYLRKQGLAKELPVPRTVSGLKCTLNAFDGDSNGYAESDNDDDDDDY